MYITDKEWEEYKDLKRLFEIDLSEEKFFILAEMSKFRGEKVSYTVKFNNERTERVLLTKKLREGFKNANN